MSDCNCDELRKALEETIYIGAWTSEQLADWEKRRDAALATHKAKEVEYRMFDPRKEPVEDGDEFQEPDGKWHPFSFLCFGMTLARHAKAFPSRRPIQKEAP